MILSNQSGQALVETFVSLPTMIAIFGGICALCYTLSLEFLVDDISYRATLCLASSEYKDHCRSRLHRELRILPLASFAVVTFDRTRQVSQAEIHYTDLTRRSLKIKNLIKLPLHSTSFRE